MRYTVVVINSFLNHTKAPSSMLYSLDDVCNGYELNAYFNTKFNEQEEKLTKTFNNNIDDLYNVQIQNEVSKRCKETESENKNAKKQVEELKKLSIENRSKKRN